MKILNLISFLLIVSNLFSTIINVPADQPTIQDGIVASVDADTVLVQPGTYVENINYIGKNITVASLFLTTQDTTYISQTAIDGNQNGSVVRFVNGEDSTAVLCGFTIANGSAEFGGGICCGDSSPTLVNVTITGNLAFVIQTMNAGGGGIFCWNSSPILQNVTISGNSTDNLGGGIACWNYSNPTLTNVTLTDNSADWYGGGISCYDNSSPILVNCILWNDTPSEIAGPATVSFSDIQGDWEGEGNIDEDPLFENPIEGDYHLTENSPCIDAGDLLSPPDPDSSRADMGAYYYDQIANLYAQFSADVLEGEVPLSVQFTDNTVIQPISWEWDFDNDGTIDSYEQNPSYIYQNYGYYSVSLTVEDDIGNSNIMVKTDYIAVYSPAYSGHIFHIDPEGSDELGNGSLEYPFATIQHGINIAANSDTVLVHPGTYFENINYLGKNLILGSLFLTTQDTTFISQTVIDGFSLDSVVKFENEEDSTSVLTGFTITNGDATHGGGIYCENSNPSLVNITITGNFASGDYAYGGGICLWNNSSPILQNITITGNSVSSTVGFGGGICLSNNSSPILQNVTITGNTASFGGGIYIGGGTQNLVNVTISGNTASNNGGGIYCASSYPSFVNCIMWNDTPEEVYFYSGSVTITYSDIQGGWTGIGNIDEDPLFVGTGDHPFMLQDLSPCVNAGIPDTTGLNLPEFDLAGNPRVYGGRIDMGAYENQNVVGANEDLIPLVTKLNQNYPNPFNPTTTISFSLTTEDTENTELVIYNIKGQKVKQLVSDQLSAGQHSVVWNGRDDNGKSVSSGIYFYKMKAEDFEKTRKMILMK